MKHSLTNKNKPELVADCSVCGPAAPIKLNGKYGVVCVEARRVARRNYKKAHPDRARAGRAYNPSAHQLTEKTGKADTCVLCGPVTPKAWGRGWICPTILTEKGWTSSQTEPTPRCPLCSKRFLDAAGKCPSCDAEYEDLVEGLDPGFLTEIYEAGMHIETAASWLETDTTPAVHGWKTLGSTAPVTETPKVRPEYASLYGSGSR
jgi:hypothetical protein